MTEFHFKSIDEKGDLAVVLAETDIEALKNLKAHYPKCEFQLIDKFCLDCD